MLASSRDPPFDVGVTPRSIRSAAKTDSAAVSSITTKVHVSARRFRFFAHSWLRRFPPTYLAKTAAISCCEVELVSRSLWLAGGNLAARKPVRPLRERLGYIGEEHYSHDHLLSIVSRLEHDAAPSTSLQGRESRSQGRVRR